MSIDYLNGCCSVNRNGYSVYDFNHNTVQQLLCEFFTKINECVDSSNKALEFMEWIKEEGLPLEVVKYLNQMLEDGTLADLINKTIFEDLNSKLENIAHIFDTDFPRINNETKDNARLKRAIATAKDGDVILFDNIIYDFDVEKISINKQLTLLGKKKPINNGTNLINGTVFKSIGLKLESDNILIENIGLDSPEIDNTFQANTIGVNGITIKKCSTISQAHGYLFESYNGTVLNVLVENCNSFGGYHGFISKAINVTFLNCSASNHKGFAFGNIADNINGTSNANNRNNRVINCQAYECNVGFICYSRDTKSGTGSNNIYLKELVWSLNYAYDCTTSYALGDTGATPSGQYYNSVRNVIIDNCQDQVSGGNRSLAVGRCVLSKVTNCNFSGQATYQYEFNPDCIIEPSGNIQLDYPQRHQDVTLTSGELKVFNANLNPIISVSASKYQELHTITCNLTNVETITIKLSDDFVVIKNGTGANEILLSREYQGKHSFVVLKKRFNGTWYELYGYTG